MVPGGGGGPGGGLLLRPVGKLSMLSEIVKVVDGGGGGGGRFKMLSGKFFGLSEKYFGLPEKYCPWPPLKHWSHGATEFKLGIFPGRNLIKNLAKIFIKFLITLLSLKFVQDLNYKIHVRSYISS